MNVNIKTHTHEPFVSVIMPVFNCETYIETAIRSVIAQTYTNWELIVVDDGSTDFTISIIEHLVLEDKRIRLLRNPVNMGVAETRNRGFDACRGEYIALLDSDDKWNNDKLEKQLVLAQETEADVIYCSYGIVDEHGEKICEDFIVPNSTDYEHMMIRTVISCSTALLSRSVIERYRFHSGYYHEDLVFWLEILRDGNKACGIVEVLADYRLLQGSRASNKVKSAMERWKIYRKHLNEPFLTCLKAIIQYSLLALKKYKRVGIKRHDRGVLNRNK